MANETKIQADAAAEAPAKVAKTVADTIQKVADETAKSAKRARSATKRRSKRASAKASRSKARTNRSAARKPATAASNQRKPTMNFIPGNAFPGFDAFTGAAPFQSLFADAGERGQEAVKRSQKVAQELADLTRANVEAMVEATRLATEGARSIGQDAVARTREGAEQAADAIRSLAEARSPTEFVQLQGQLARTSFDRMVAQSSRLTESMVKLAGEAFQPLSNRATANAERINNLVA